MFASCVQVHRCMPIGRITTLNHRAFDVTRNPRPVTSRERGTRSFVPGNVALDDVRAQVPHIKRRGATCVANAVTIKNTSLFLNSPARHAQMPDRSASFHGKTTSLVRVCGRSDTGNTSASKSCNLCVRLAFGASARQQTYSSTIAPCCSYP